VPIYIQPNKKFRLPVATDAPVIMIGPGTGIAPFRGFLHERQATGAKGKNWLFFGERSAKTDFLYREELEKMQADGHLTRLDTAFSRDQEKKIYVQDRMLEQAAQMWQWMQDGAIVYVCGDATHMARDVDAGIATAARSGAAVLPSNGERYFDASPISLVFDTWIADVAALAGREIDPQRYRPNLYATAAPDFTLREPALVGRLLAIGAVRLRVTSTIGRCVTTTYDVASGDPDPNVLRVVAQQRANVVGVYGTTERTGAIAVGDAIVLLDEP